MNGHVELQRSCRVKKSRFEHLNQSLLFDQLVNRYADNTHTHHTLGPYLHHRVPAGEQRCELVVTVRPCFSTAEAVLQEMDNISSIRQSREVERLRMWTDTEVVSLALHTCKAFRGFL